MDMNIDEQWLEIPKVQNRKNSIVAISNTGKYKRGDGTEGILGLRQIISTKYGRIRSHRIIAENFLITVRRQDQICIDHITHYPTVYNVNDVRNLRWCTHDENCNFEEARENKSGVNSPMYGRNREKCPNWKGDAVGPQALYKRALIEYRNNPTEENLATLNEARLRRNEYRSHLRRAKKLRQ